MIESILEIEEPESYERKDKDSTSNSLRSSSQETLFQIEKAHLMDPDMVPDLFWKQGNLYNPKSDQVGLNLFPNLPENVVLIDEIPGFAKGKENDIGSILLEEVEGSDFNEDQKEDLLNLVSLYKDIFIEKPFVVGPVLEELMKRLILYSGSFSICFSCFCRGKT